VVFARLLGLNRAAARRRAAELVDEFGLADAAKRPAAKFSGGMRRRLDLAASLIAAPPLIFLDEPTTGLDPRTRARMWQTIGRLAGAGSTVLLTTQYLDEADQLADRVAVIDRGTVVAEGTPDELKASAGQSSLQLRLADPGQTPHAREAIMAVLAVDAIPSPEGGRITAPMDEPDLITDLLVALRDRGIRLAGLSVHKPTLDQVFLAITGHETQPQDDREEEKEEAVA
jgi:daunorubicin/doxorubicin transport system ATP-binding protein